MGMEGLSVLVSKNVVCFFFLTTVSWHWFWTDPFVENNADISAGAKRPAGRQMRPMKRSGEPDITKYWSDWQPKNFFCQSPCPIALDNAAMLDVWLSNYAYFFFQYFYVWPGF